MSRSNHPRKVAWTERFRAPAIKASVTSPQGMRLDFTMALTEDQHKKLIDLLFPKRAS